MVSAGVSSVAERAQRKTLIRIERESVAQHRFQVLIASFVSEVADARGQARRCDPFAGFQHQRRLTNGCSLRVFSYCAAQEVTGHRTSLQFHARARDRHDGLCSRRRHRSERGAADASAERQ
jgi:hypothetical protein